MAGVLSSEWAERKSRERDTHVSCWVSDLARVPQQRENSKDIER